MRKIIRILVFLLTTCFILSELVYAQLKIPKGNIPPDLDPAIKVQIERLYSSNPEERILAAQKIGEMGEKAIPAIPFLIAILNDLSWNHAKPKSTCPAQEAANALVKIGKPAVEPLIAVLDEQGYFEVRILGDIKDVRAVEPLIAALKYKEDGYSQAEADAPGRQPGIADFRSQAAESLGKIKDVRAVEPLIEALHDKYWLVRSSAARALGEMGDTRARQPLIAALKDKNSDVRKEAAEALGKFQDQNKDSVEQLIVLLRGSDTFGLHSIVKTLGQIGDSRAFKPLVALYFRLSQARQIDSGLIEEILNVLAKINKPQEKELIAELKDKNEETRKIAVFSLALMKTKDKRAVEPLITALKDKNTDISFYAGEALRGIGAPAVKPLTPLLNDEDIEIQNYVTDILASMGKPAVEPLMEALKDPREEVRWQVAFVLGTIKDPRAVPALIAALREQDIGVYGRVVEALKSIGEPAVEPLIMALKDQDENISGGAAETLGKIKDLRATEPLIAAFEKAVKDQNQTVAFKAAEALGELQDVRAVVPLLSSLKSKNTLAELQVILALQKIGKPSIEPLITELKSKDESARKEAVELLTKIVDRSFGDSADKWLAWYEERKNLPQDLPEELRKKISDFYSPYPKARSAAVYSIIIPKDIVSASFGDLNALAQIKVINNDAIIALPYLVKMLEDFSPNLLINANYLPFCLTGCKYEFYPIFNDYDPPAEAAARVLVLIGEPAVKPLINALTNETEIVKRLAVWSLGGIKDKRATEPLIKLLQEDNKYTKICAIWALGEIKDERAAKPLNLLLSDKDAEVRGYVATALKNITGKDFDGELRRKEKNG